MKQIRQTLDRRFAIHPIGCRGIEKRKIKQEEEQEQKKRKRKEKEKRNCRPEHVFILMRVSV